MIWTIFPSAREQKNRAYTYLCAGSVICVSPLWAPQFSIFACCLIPVLTLVVLLVVLDDMDDISFSKRTKKQGIHISLRRFSDMCIPPVSATIFHLCMLFDSRLNPSCVTSCVRWYWRYFLQQENKKTGDTHISAPVQWYVYPSCERHIIPSLHVVWFLS